jgi:hypothetical protein
MITDEVCAKYANKFRRKKKKDKLHVYVKDSADYKDNMVFIEGDAESLEFLGNLLLAKSIEEDYDGREIGPRVAGNIFFNRDSTHNLYIYRLPP